MDFDRREFLEVYIACESASSNSGLLLLELTRDSFKFYRVSTKSSVFCKELYKTEQTADQKLMKTKNFSHLNVLRGLAFSGGNR